MNAIEVTSKQFEVYTLIQKGFSYSEVVKELKSSNSTISNAINELASSGLIEIHRPSKRKSEYIPLKKEIIVVAQRSSKFVSDRQK